MKVVATPEATAQLESRKSWWRANRPETADLFDQEFADAVAIIAERPSLFAVTMKLGDREIRRVLMEAVKRARSAAEAELKTASARIHADLARSVADTAARIADRRASTKRWQWIAISLAIATAGLTTVNVLASRSGRAVGHADGYQAARDERAAESWANTPEGQLAYGLAKAGSIRVLATCSGRGWVVKDAYCFPRADSGSVYGWRLSAP